MRGLRALLLLAATLALTTGCEPPPDVEPLPCRNPEPGVAELGVGDLSTGFLQVVEGDDIPVVFGPQGMHMVVVSSRVLNMEPAQAGGIGNRVSVALRHDGVVVGGTVNDMQPSADTPAGTDFLGIRAVITHAEVEDLDQVVADVEVVVRDGCGRELVAERELRFVL